MKNEHGPLDGVQTGLMMKDTGTVEEGMPGITEILKIQTPRNATLIR